MKRALRAPAAAVAEGRSWAQGTRLRPGTALQRHPYLLSTDRHNPRPARAIPLSQVPSLPSRSISQQQESVVFARPCFPGGSGEGCPAPLPGGGKQVFNGTPPRWQRSAPISSWLRLPAGRDLLLHNLLARCWRLYKLPLTLQAATGCSQRDGGDSSSLILLGTAAPQGAGQPRLEPPLRRECCGGTSGSGCACPAAQPLEDKGQHTVQRLTQQQSCWPLALHADTNQEPATDVFPRYQL